MSDGLMLFGKIALKNKLLDEAQLEEALKLQEEARKIGLQENLGTICVRLGYLSAEEVEKILQVQLRKETKDKSKLYGKIALENKFLKAGQIEEALKMQKEQKYRSPIGQYLLKMGHISMRDHKAILQVIERVRGDSPEEHSNSATSISARISSHKQEQQHSKNPEEKKVKKEKSSSSRRIKKKKSPSSQSKSPPPPSSLKPSLANIFPGYTLLEKLGQGAMGVVYKAVQESLGKEVAIKILPPDFAQDQTRVQRFIREAQSTGKLHHPNIIRAIDMGQKKGYVYYVMEYVEGETLNKIIAGSNFLEEDWALEITREIAKALAHAWKHKIIHRDIKPENIMISKEGFVKLCDLGLAKSAVARPNEVRLTMAGNTVGTPLYMSPEQAKGEDVDIRTDIYALGVTLFEMVTGNAPFIHHSPVIVMQKHLMDEVPMASDKKEDVSLSTSRLICKMMAKKLKNRFANPEEVVEAVDLILSGNTYPPSGKKKKKKSDKKDLKKKILRFRKKLRKKRF